MQLVVPTKTPYLTKRYVPKVETLLRRITSYQRRYMRLQAQVHRLEAENKKLRTTIGVLSRRPFIDRSGKYRLRGMPIAKMAEAAP